MPPLEPLSYHPGQLDSPGGFPFVWSYMGCVNDYEVPTKDTTFDDAWADNGNTDWSAVRALAFVEIRNGGVASVNDCAALAEEHRASSMGMEQGNQCW